MSSPKSRESQATIIIFFIGELGNYYYFLYRRVRQLLLFSVQESQATIISFFTGESSNYYYFLYRRVRQLLLFSVQKSQATIIIFFIGVRQLLIFSL